MSALHFKLNFSFILFENQWRFTKIFWFKGKCRSWEHSSISCHLWLTLDLSESEKLLNNDDIRPIIWYKVRHTLSVISFIIIIIITVISDIITFIIHWDQIWVTMTTDLLTMHLKYSCQPYSYTKLLLQTSCPLTKILFTTGKLQKGMTPTNVSVTIVDMTLNWQEMT